MRNGLVRMVTTGLGAETERIATAPGSTPMATVTADHELLFGTLAVQMGYLRVEDLVAAVCDWQADRSPSLAQVLERHGVLTGERRMMVEAMARTLLDVFGDDSRRALAALPLFPAVREALAPIAGDALNARLARAAAEPDPDATLPPAIVVARSARIADYGSASETVELALGPAPSDQATLPFDTAR